MLEVRRLQPSFPGFWFITKEGRFEIQEHVGKNTGTPHPSVPFASPEKPEFKRTHILLLFLSLLSEIYNRATTISDGIVCHEDRDGLGRSPIRFRGA